MKKFFIKNMGCKSNQFEGSLIEENLINNGFKKAESAKDADIFILNSCTVTHKSDNEAFYILKQTKKQNPGAKTVLTGCIAQIQKEELLKNPNIDIVIGNDEKLDISKHLSTNYSVTDLNELKSFHTVFLNDTKKTRASLKIQDGCNNRCSYCIIPFARGKSRSANVESILEQIKIYENDGFKEIVLTGIHIGQWGEDKNNLLYLLENIEEKTNIQRFRLGSLNPLEIDEKMLEFLKKSEKFCPHFHLSIQSMCDKTLKSMNRHYTVSQTLDLIENITEIYPLAFIGSDVIAGFAGETEDDFQSTIENLNKSKLTKIHTFPYSVRKGTLAEKIEGHVADKTKEIRANIIKEISANKYAKFLNKNLNSVQEVLIEKNKDKKTGFFKGVSRNYLNILINPNTCEIEHNSLVQVRVQSVGTEIFGSKI